MELKLTERETEMLRELLHDYLPLLGREVVRTEKVELRHMLVERQNLVERLLEELGAAVR
jgi:hypothetical protein